MNGDDGLWWFHSLDRRELLTAVGTAAATTSAGCSENLLDGGQNESDGDETTTTDFGYGGTPRTATPTDDGTAPATATTPASETTDATGSGTTTSTDSTTTPAGTTTSGTPTDAYGVQGYGQYGYGG